DDRMAMARSFFLSFMVLFFFSSRRRHTRFSRDWSSDVCSSDLNDDAVALLATDGADEELKRFIGLLADNHRLVLLPEIAGLFERSEERRVGKEWRSRWSAQEEEKKTEQKREPWSKQGQAWRPAS